ncbi:patatin-like phospholipase family protein [Aspergillus stella-maris]|uniref:patatin-like phospholipase family protein n=1 Tax=Aspergillus stella-maris TaxID=1810926 RepID=UPI003CCD55D2
MAPWLGLEWDAGGWTLTDTGCVQQILDAALKAQALRVLHPYNNIQRYSRTGVARMHLIQSELRPAILIETSKSPGSTSRPPLSKPLRLYPVQDSHDRTCDDVQNMLFRHVMMPLADTVCLFAADLGGLEGISILLAAWSQFPLASPDGSPFIHARLIIVLTDPGDMTGTARETEVKLREIAVPKLAAALSVLDLRHRDGLSPASQFEPLRQHLLQELDYAHITRSQARLLFSRVHLEWVFRESLSHVTRWPTTPFNCIQACRLDRARDDGMIGQYLESFLCIAEKASVPTNSLAAFIASAFLMDAYPPGMHGFHPKIMFQTLYAGHCRTACPRRPHNPEMALWNQVETRFVTLFSVMSPAISSSRIRRDSLRQDMSVWADVKTNQVCLLCLCRPPEHVLPCGHAICDICTCIFGVRGQGAEYHFDMTACPLCLKSFSLTVRLLPPTKRPTILVLDGGGVRGVITLGFLKALENQVVGLGGLREAFDLNVGTSVGGLILSDVVVCGERVDDARAKFITLARRIFPQRPLAHTLVGRSWSFLRSWLADSRHDSEGLDEALKETFSTLRRLFDTTLPLVSGIRVALTASQVDKDGSLCLFSNYRGLGRSTAQSAYKVLIPEGEEPRLWEVARCCVAALGYFTTKHLPDIGTFQDGGVSANCPLRPAIRESEIIWPACTRPDLVVSIGTGYPNEQSSNPSPRGFWSGGFVERAIRTFLQSPAVNSRRGWQDALDSIAENVRPDVFRLDREVAGDLPELDDSSALEKLGQFPYSVPEELTRAWLAKCFFFELDEVPTNVLGSYKCRGSILCCKYNAGKVAQHMALMFHNARFTLSRGADLGAVEDGNGCLICGYYRKCVSFEVPSLNEFISLEVRGIAGHCAIGGFPTSLQSLLQAQQADAPFGRADHRTDLWPPPRQCYCTRTKRPRTLSNPESRPKTRRVDRL